MVRMKKLSQEGGYGFFYNPFRNKDKDMKRVEAEYHNPHRGGPKSIRLPKNMPTALRGYLKADGAASEQAGTQGSAAWEGIKNVRKVPDDIKTLDEGLLSRANSDIEDRESEAALSAALKNGIFSDNVRLGKYMNLSLIHI